MTVILQGDVRWADLPDPVGSAAAYRRPVVVVQGNDLNRSRLGTVVCVPLTTTLKWAEAPGNVLLSSTATGLKKDSVAQASQIVALDRSALEDEKEGRVGAEDLGEILSAIDLVLGR
jgi:mRNA interferase MazF